MTRPTPPSTTTVAKTPAASNPQLPAMAKRLKEIDALQTALGSEYDSLFETFHDIADDVAGTRQSYRYLDHNEEWFVARVGTSSQRIDIKKLQELLTAEQWKGCTRQVRQFDEQLLEQAVARGKIKLETVQQVTEKTEGWQRRTGPATKQDLQTIEKARRKK